LIKNVEEAIEDYNNRPHDVLQGLTPLEVLHGKRIDKVALHQQMASAKINRIAANKKMKCCHYTF
jgi:hypothetical protein